MDEKQKEKLMGIAKKILEVCSIDELKSLSLAMLELAIKMELKSKGE